MELFPFDDVRKFFMRLSTGSALSSGPITDPFIYINARCMLKSQITWLC